MMNENDTLIVFNPSKAQFLKRVLGGFKPIIVLAILLMMTVGLVYRESGLRISILISLAFIVYVFLDSFYRNVFYLKSLTINKENKKISLEINKYDRITESIKCSNDKLSIELKEVVVIYESYYLIIRDAVNNRRIIKQGSVGGWNKKLFSEIIKALEDIK